MIAFERGKLLFVFNFHPDKVGLLYVFYSELYVAVIILIRALNIIELEQGGSRSISWLLIVIENNLVGRGDYKQAIRRLIQL